MILPRLASVAAICLATGAAAEGHLSPEALAGQAAFKLCQSCHVVTDPEGNRLAGRGAASGLNLYGVVGRSAGTLEGFRYSSAMRDAGAAGLVWDEARLVAFLLDPKGYIQEVTGDPSARTKMVLRLRPDRRNDLSAEAVARNIARYLEEVGPAPVPGDG